MSTTTLKSHRLPLLALIICCLLSCDYLDNQVSAEVPWAPIRDVRSPKVIEYGKFAVDRFNRQKNIRFEFVSVFQGATRKINGGNTSIWLDVLVKVAFDLQDIYRAELQEDSRGVKTLDFFYKKPRQG